jgi:WD40 repeat protein
MNYAAAALSVLLVAIPATAQLDRRSRDEPEVFVDAGGPSGTCDVLLFSRDGKYLYRGGDDKVVIRWPIGAAGLETGNARTFRWPAWREQRGGIKTLALPNTPADRRLFVAGYGMASGLAVLLDKDGEVVATNQIPGKKLPGTNIMSSSFTPKGESVIYGTADGRLWEWDFKESNREIGRHDVVTVRDPKTGEEVEQFNRPRIIRFREDGSFVSVAQTGQVLAWTPNGKNWNPRELFSVVTRFKADVKNAPAAKYSVFRADITADGKWLACSVEPNYLVLCPLGEGKAKAIRVPFVVRSLAFDKAGRLAVALTADNVPNATGGTPIDFQIEANDTIRVYDDALTAATPEPSATIPFVGRAEALAWDRDGRLAVAGGEDHAVTLWDPKKPSAPVDVVRGKGRTLWEARVGKDGKSFQFRPGRDAKSTDPNQRGAGPWYAFNYVTGGPAEAKEAVPIRPTADGWTIEPSRKSALIWEAVLKDGDRQVARWELPTDPDRDEQPRTYCFLPATKTTPTRVLVSHYYGFSIFSLTAAGVKRTSLATGHAGDVMSIATDADGTWAITCGMDQTVAGWSLKDWDHGPFGAALQINADGKLVVTAVDVGGPAWEMGLKKADEIVLAVKTVGKKHHHLLLTPGKYQAGEFTTAEGSTAKALAALSDPEPGLEYYLGWKRPGQATPMEGLSSVRRRPLWRFFPAFDANGRLDQWMAWIWRGGHYATSTSGDELVGWQMNDPATITRKKPEFARASLYRDVLERPVAVMNLMRTRDLEATLRELTDDNPQPPKFGDIEPAPVRVIPRQEAVGADGLPVEIDVSARTSNPDLLPERVELWVNDHRFASWKANKQQFGKAITIPPEAFRRGENQVTVATFNAAGGRRQERATVTADLPERAPRLFALMVGVNDYTLTALNKDGAREFGNLENARNDAKKLGERWQALGGKGRYYDQVDVTVTLDPKANQEDILKALDKLVKGTTPDDRVVVFLAGHGDFVPRPGAPKGSADKVFVFCCPNYDRANFEKTGVTGEMLFERLARCPARKLVLIDACHAGQAASEGVIRNLIPTGLGPTVIAACDQKEKSYEDTGLGHGLFTAAVMEALGDKFADAAKDGTLDSRRLFDYVRGRLPELARKAKKPEGAQNPQVFPPDPPTFPIARR